MGCAVDTSGNLYIADTVNNVIRRITISSGNTVTIAGGGSGGGTPNSTGVYLEGTGTQATFNVPYGLTLDISGNLFIADRGNHAIRRIVLATGEVSTVAGSGISGITRWRFGTNDRFKPNKFYRTSRFSNGWCKRNR